MSIRHRIKGYSRSLPSLQRSDQKKALRAVIAMYRGDPEIMGDPHTDRRPLILAVDCGEVGSDNRQPVIGDTSRVHREEEHEAIATLILDEIAAERGWDERFAKTQDQLGALVRSARSEVAWGGVASGDPCDRTVKRFSGPSRSLFRSTCGCM
jgi:hypothetical protein